MSYTDKTNAEFLYGMFVDSAKGNNKTKEPTDEEIKSQADEYFKSFGLPDVCEKFFEEIKAQQAKRQEEMKLRLGVVREKLNAKRPMLHIQSEAKKEPQKVGFLNMFKKDKSMDV